MGKIRSNLRLAYSWPPSPIAIGVCVSAVVLASVSQGGKETGGHVFLCSYTHTAARLSCCLCVCAYVGSPSEVTR